MSTLLLPPILQGTLPGFPEAPVPSPWHILVFTLLIPGAITLLAVGLGLGRRWLKQDDDAQVRPLPTPSEARRLPSPQEIEARRELVHNAAVHNEGRPDVHSHLSDVKRDPNSFHP